MDIKYSVKPNGTFDLLLNGTIALEDCYPEINGRFVRAETITTDCEHIILELGFMKLMLALKQENGTIAVRIATSECNVKYHDIGLNGRLSKDILGIFRASGQLGEECGYESAKMIQKRPITKSRGILGLTFCDCTLIAFVSDHTHWHQEFYVRNDCEKITSVSGLFRTENVNHDSDTFPPIYLKVFNSLNEGLEKAAGIIGSSMGARKRMPPAYHWCSWYYNYSEFNEEQLDDYLEGFSHVDGHGDLQYIQIDAGNCKEIGDWLEPRCYWKSGLDVAIEKIQRAGYTPGIWIGPYMVGNHSMLAKEHQDWLLKDLNGDLVIGMCTDNEPKLWGYHDEEYYILDTSHPDAFAYLRKVFRTMKSWGIRMFKTDFMLWGYQDSSLVKRAVPGKTSVEYFRDLLQMIREEIGEESYWLGCIAPFYPFIGFADGMRIGGDVGSSWDGEFGPQNMIRSVEGNFYTNFHYYQNDPDAVMLRNFHIRLNEKEIISLALYQCLSGGCIYTSDPLNLLPKERLRLWRFIKPSPTLRPLPNFPFIEEEKPEKVVSYCGTGGHGLIFIFNPTNFEITGRYSLRKMGFADRIYITEKEADSVEINKVLFSTIQPHDYRLYAVSSAPRKYEFSNIWEMLY